LTKKSNKLAITLPDYQRMHRVIASVLNSVEANTPKACLFFAVAGAFLIEQVHKRPARTAVGAAFYRVDDNTGFTMAFGRCGENTVSSDDEAFHCWIESDGMVIDLLAPIFQESVLSGGRTEEVARRMFQRPLSEMASTPYELDQVGDFFLQHDPVLQLSLMESFMTKPANGDLVNVCHYWYAPYPKKMLPTMRMGSDDGSFRDIKLGPIEIVGAW
jgi:hypothetical protein